MSREELRINEEIRVREVRLVGVNGEQLGIMDSRTALQIAAEHQLDLVEIAPTARPPVCKIMDYGRHKYEQHKREKEAKKKQRVIVVKEVKFRPGIEDHDFTVKMKNARRFLADGDKVKATIMFRGRQLAHPELGKDVLDRLAQSLQDVANVEKEAKLEGRNMTMILAPRASSGRGRAGQAPATT